MSLKKLITIKILFSCFIQSFHVAYKYPENDIPSTGFENTKSDLPLSKKKRTLQDTDINNSEPNEENMYFKIWQHTFLSIISIIYFVENI